MRVLILDAGNTSSYHVMRSLVKAGYEAHLSSPDDCIWFSSRYCARAIQSPPGQDTARFTRFLLDLVARGSYDLLLACGDLETEIIHDHRHELARYVRCFLPDESVREVALRKNAAYRHARSIGVATPMFHVPADVDELRRIGGQISLPAVIKGELGSAGAHVRYATTLEELVKQYREVESSEREAGGRPTVQEYVPGPGYVVHCLFHEGRALAICSHRKEREVPLSGGVTSAAITVHEPALDRAALTFLESLCWTGLAKLDFKRDSRDGRFKFLEVDGRVSASIDITRVAGADQARMLCALAAGERVAPALGYRAGVRYRWLFPRDLLNLLARPWRVPVALLELASARVHHDLELGDWRPLRRAARIAAWHVKEQLRTGAVWRQDRLRSALCARSPASVPGLRVPGRSGAAAANGEAEGEERAAGQAGLAEPERAQAHGQGGR